MQKLLALAKKQVRLIAVSIAAIGMVVGNLSSVAAAALEDVSTELSDPRPSQAAVTYTFDVGDGFSATAAKCILVEFNTETDGGGSVPTGLDNTGASLSSSTAITAVNWTDDASVNGVLELTNATGEIPVAGNFVWAGIDNGSVVATSYYAIIDTYSDEACSVEIDHAVSAFVYKAGELVQLTIPPTLVFTVDGVASGEDVWPENDPGILDTTVASTAAGIDHGESVTATTNGISAHDINVTTNASGGYNVYLRHTGQLANGVGDTIDNHTGTKLVPVAFPAAGNESWGYTTDDTDEYLGADMWAQFPTADGSGGDVVMSNVAQNEPSGETARVSHQVGIADTTEAGTYLTTIIYTLVATF